MITKSKIITVEVPDDLLVPIKIKVPYGATFLRAMIRSNLLDKGKNKFEIKNYLVFSYSLDAAKQDSDEERIIILVPENTEFDHTWLDTYLGMFNFGTIRYTHIFDITDREEFDERD